MAGQYWDNADKGIDSVLRGGARANMQSMKSHTSAMTQMDNFQRQLGRQQQEFLRKTKNSARESAAQLDGFMRKLDGLENRLHIIQSSMIGLFDTVTKEAKNSGDKLDQFLGKMTKHGRGAGAGGFFGIMNMGGGGKRGGGGFGFGGRGGMGGELREIVGLIPRFLPALTMLASVSAAVYGLVKALFEFESETQDIRIATGGAEGRVRAFDAAVTNLSKTTHTSTEDLYRMTEAFFDAGVSVNKLGTDMTSYLEVGAKAKRLFQVSDQEAGKYFRTLKDQGLSFAEMHEDINSSVKSMTRLGLTARDVGAAFGDANYAYEKYGGLLGKNIKDFKDGFVGMRSLFKAMNMDADQAARSYGDLMGSMDKQLTQSAYLSAITGADQNSMFWDLRDPMKGTQARMTGGLKGMAQLLGPYADAMRMSDDQVRGRWGDAQGRMIMQRMSYAKDALVEQGGFDPAMLEGVMAQFRNKGGKGDIMSAIDKFLPNMLDAQKGQERTVQQTVSALNDTVSEQFAQIGRRIEAKFKDTARWVQQYLSPFLKSATGWIDKSWPVVQKWFSDVYNWWNARWGAASEVLPSAGAIGNAGSQIWEGMKSDPGFLGKLIPGAIMNLFKGDGGGGRQRSVAESVKEVLRAARDRGADPIDAVSTMLQESYGNNRIAGDPGIYQNGKFISKAKMKKLGMDTSQAQNTSFGLFQLHKGGKLGKMTAEQAYDPYMNAMVALKEFGTLRKAHPDWSSGQLAAAAQRPHDPAAYAASVNAKRAQAVKLIQATGMYTAAEVPQKIAYNAPAPPPGTQSFVSNLVDSGGKSGRGESFVAPPGANVVSPEQMRQIELLQGIHDSVKEQAKQNAETNKQMKEAARGGIDRNNQRAAETLRGGNR